MPIVSMVRQDAATTHYAESTRIDRRAAAGLCCTAHLKDLFVRIDAAYALA